MNQTTAVAMFAFLAYTGHLNLKVKESCYAVTDTTAKLAICKGVSYKEQQK